MIKIIISILVVAASLYLKPVEAFANGNTYLDIDGKTHKVILWPRIAAGGVWRITKLRNGVVGVQNAYLSKRSNLTSLRAAAVAISTFVVNKAWKTAFEEGHVQQNKDKLIKDKAARERKEHIERLERYRSGDRKPGEAPRRVDELKDAF